MRSTTVGRLASLTIAMSVIVAACSTPGAPSVAPTSVAPSTPASSAPASAPASAASEPTKLVVYSAEPGSVAGYEQALAPFEAERNVTVEFISYESADFLTQFPNAVRSDSQIDVLLVNGQDVRTLVGKDLLGPITDVVDKAAMIPPALDPFTIDGQLYAVGVNTMYTTGVAVNTDLLAKHKLEQPTSFAALKANVAKLEGTGVSLFSVPGSNIYLWPIWYMQAIQQASGGDISDFTARTLAGKVSFTAPEYVAAMEALKEIGSMGIFQPGYAGVDQAGANATMIQGKAVMFYGGTWDISAIANEATFPLNVTFFPTFVEGADVQPAGGAAIAAAIYAKVDPARQELAAELVRFLTSAAGEEATLVATKAGFPLPTAVGVTVESSDVAKQVATDIAPKTFTFLDWSWPKEVTAAFQQAIPAVVAGKQQPADAMADVQAAFEEAKANGWTP